ncbi:hypothetical protein [Acidianus ambivalens]|uniref:Uncharacterized protein n=1 Tax=Acidianus ambivalens TaxID=2283 RepID=A0A650CUQ7_ACIAM|nr:hypothetical protein [Acidianus ambivalens]MQL56268.1 hypothetical protein [Acidianus ambivalens]QGR21197.1 hypothetical protein D1866_03620 [Acidianus ambivalens]
MSRRVIVGIISLIAFGVFLGLAMYLYSIDHMSPTQYKVYSLQCTPPWYAALWPIFLESSLLLLGIAVHSFIYSCRH